MGIKFDLNSRPNIDQITRKIIPGSIADGDTAVREEEYSPGSASSLMADFCRRGLGIDNFSALTPADRSAAIELINEARAKLNLPKITDVEK